MDKKFFNIFFATIIFVCAFFVPEVSQAYKGRDVSCFSWNDCLRWLRMSIPFYKAESSLSTNMRKNIDKVKIVLVYE